MKKILYLLVLTTLFVSCSSDDDNNSDKEKQNGKGMIDEKILGKWKVEYSKTIKPAVYNEITGKVEYDEKDAKITEYDGKLTSEISSYMFNSSEKVIEINEDNSIKICWYNTDGKLTTDPKKDIYYKIEDGYLKWENKPLGDGGGLIFSYNHKYYIEDKNLVIERIPTEKTQWIYVISKYSKITE